MSDNTTTYSPRMTLTFDNHYSYDDVKRFLGLGINTNLSRVRYPELLHIPGHGYSGESIVETIDNRGNRSLGGRKGNTRIVSRWIDSRTGAERAEIQYR